MSEWRKVRVGDVAEEVTVGFVGSMAAEYVEDGVPFLRSLNVRPHRIDMADVKYIGSDFHRRLRKSTLRPGDVVTVRTGKPGQTAVVPSWLPEANCADLVITRVGQSLDARWFSYYMNSIITGHIAGHLVGAVQQHFNVRAVESIELLLPSFAEQRAIGELLGALDEKIAAGERSVHLIEEIMIVLAGQSGHSASVGEVAEHLSRASTPASFATSVALYSLPAFDDSADPLIASYGEIKSNKFTLAQPVVLVSKLNPRIPRVWNVSEVSELMAVASTEFVVLAPRGVSTSALWSAIRQPTVSSDLASRVSGTSGSHQRVKPADILDLSIPDPRWLPDRLRAQIDALGNLAVGARAERRPLAATRDELLPLLMSGKVRVKDAEKVVEEVV